MGTTITEKKYENEHTLLTKFENNGYFLITPHTDTVVWYPDIDI